jgi:hypothetical protein
MKVRFIINPVGQFNLAYDKGDIVEVDAELGVKLIKAEVAEAIKDPGSVETSESKVKAEKAVRDYKKK